MARTPSNMIALGSTAPAFWLPDTISGNSFSLNELKGKKGTFIMFICNHCPFVKHVNPKLSELARSYQPKGIQFIAISSNDVLNYPQDSPELMKETAAQEGYTFPYLYDESQEVAKSYEAACTPDFYLYDENLKLVYRGQLDGSRPGNDEPLTANDVIKAFDHLLAGKPQAEIQLPSIGCNIKWKEHH